MKTPLQTIKIRPDDLLCTVLDQKHSLLLRALALQQFATAFHLGVTDRRGKEEKQERPLTLIVPKKLLGDVRIMAATKLLEATLEESWLPQESAEAEKLLALRLFKVNGGFERLRHAISVRTIEKRMSQARLRMREVGRTASITLRASTAPDPETLSPYKAIRDFAGSSDMRDAFGLKRGSTKNSAWFAERRQTVAFAHLVYVTYQGRMAIGKFSRPKSKGFIGQITQRARDRDGILRFISDHNELCRQLNEVGYDCPFLAVPNGVVLPAANIRHEIWPASLRM